MYRPRLYFDIVPGRSNPNLLDVVLGNCGRIPAYNINCKFEVDLLYYENITLSQLPIFKNLPFLGPGQEIRFFFRDFRSVLEERPAYGKKKTMVIVTYDESNKGNGSSDYTEQFDIDIERYKGILSVERHDVNDLFKELSAIRRQLDRLQSRGLLVKTPQDVQDELDRFKQSVEQRKRTG